MNLAGIRIGAVITQNKDLLHVVKNTSMYTAVPAIVQKAATKLLNDAVWMDEVFLPIHQQRLCEAAHKTRSTLASLGVEVRPAQAGFFLWADFRRFLPTLNHDGELALFKHFMARKVYVTPGSEMRCADPGWFRIVFSAAPHILEEGLSRIADTLKEFNITKQDL
ncbi:1-aminocyclopropane-1-carboxylate synthase-like protein 1 [Zootermopsis nevadensis]|uniref:1-aminocyclopropane-1-carboxylate synthase-like protein 1 n=2 Tax=Zootermopsis nevadensis TaxID=136037 RepID=A0A067QSE7_ZOONE|nr:1-aminocyclopropane-1-carboxylate synthase-like protein 1 [Zootermopsis nevadensis]